MTSTNVSASLTVGHVRPDRNYVGRGHSERTRSVNQFHSDPDTAIAPARAAICVRGTILQRFPAWTIVVRYYLPRSEDSMVAPNGATLVGLADLSVGRVGTRECRDERMNARGEYLACSSRRLCDQLENSHHGINMAGRALGRTRLLTCHDRDSGSLNLSVSTRQRRGRAPIARAFFRANGGKRRCTVAPVGAT